MWAAEKLEITGRDAEAYSDALAMGTLDSEPTDVLSEFARTSTARAWSNPTSKSSGAAVIFVPIAVPFRGGGRVLP